MNQWERGRVPYSGIRVRRTEESTLGLVSLRQRRWQKGERGVKNPAGLKLQKKHLQAHNIDNERGGGSGKRKKETPTEGGQFPGVSQ